MGNETKRERGRSMSEQSGSEQSGVHAGTWDPQLRLARWDSLSDAIDAATNDDGNVWARMSATAGYDFCKTESMEEATTFAISGGWDAGMKSVQVIVNDVCTHIGPIQSVSKPDPIYAMAGAVPNVPLAVAGQVQHMVTYHLAPQPRRGRVVRVGVNVGALGRVSTDRMIRRGATYVAICELLAQMGLSPEVWAVSPYHSIERGRVYATAVKVCAAGGVFDVNRATFMLAHPSALRRIMFGLRERLPVNTVDGGAYGQSKRIPDGISDALGLDVIADAPLTDAHCAPADDPVKCVIDTLEGINLL